MAHSRKRSLAETGTRPLLSHTSILIISIFVLGMATGTTSSIPADSTYLMMGVFGLISYFGLGALAATRDRRLRKQEMEQKEEALEGRLERHLSKDSQSNSPQRVAVNGADQSSQYQTVNTRAGIFQNRY
ncbi:hypothetical protein [Gimesia algae]|uniref:Uncharacterized protein n=1 Tax=Gimesia algae TaxID=2527971 RepID=A0A517VEJ6_9PLAN|nr:hypothetical protein [Gimesia algae]QDT91409.1 hypothetical protein Pan161_30660 [Gimesia algae]